MSEGAASALVKVIFDKLADEAIKKYARAQGIYSELKQLGSTLTHIQALLRDASDKEPTEAAVALWLDSLQHLAYEIDDLLDGVDIETMHRKLTQESEAEAEVEAEAEAVTCCKVRKFIPTCCRKFELSNRLSPKLDSINSRLQHLQKQKGVLGLIKKNEKPKENYSTERSFLPERDVVGREVEKEKLLKKLLEDEPSKENFSIVPIVGMGGVGKTTLATLLYNDTRVQGHFERKAIVYVSNDFNIVRISKTILEVVSGETKSFEDFYNLQKALEEQFKGKKFLLVLDDVWTENYKDWESLVSPFRFGAPGSRIIITTRKERLLKMLGFHHLDHLGNLSDKDALSLLALNALDADNFDSHPRLKLKGEGIVKKCGGLPLALKAIGRLLSTNTDEEKWDDVLNNRIWDSKIVGDLSEDWKAVLPALRLSYHELSADLKRLFAYTSLFPKNFLFDKEELVLLWMGEGFLNESNASKSPESFGHEYFDELLSRSFFQHASNDKSLFMMHDLMIDLAKFVAGEFFISFDNQLEMGKEALTKYHHMSFICNKFVGYQKFEAFKGAKHLRTFLAVSVKMIHHYKIFYLSSKIFTDLFPELPLLRVLSLSHCAIDEVPEFIGNLEHLRYLNLSYTPIVEIPENVCNLYNLQILILVSCRSLTKLPKSFLNLKKLRHFDIRRTPLLEKLPLGIGELQSLHTLGRIILGGDDGFAITELKGLKKLQGKISIEGLHKVQSAMHARQADLSLKKFTKLKLKWGDGYHRGTLENEVLNEPNPHSDRLNAFEVECYGGTEFPNWVGDPSFPNWVGDGSHRATLEKEVLNELKPHGDKLNALKVEGYGGLEFPNWVGDPSFHRLVHMSIRGCRKCTSLPPLGQLPSLKELFMQGMNKVKVIGLELFGTTVSAFASLEVLGFRDMLGWKEWSSNRKAVFPCLRELYIENCPNLIDVSFEAIPSLRVLKLDTCDGGVLRSLVWAASSITKLEIISISRLTDEVWRGVIEHLGATENVIVKKCDQLRYLWESEAEASMVFVNLQNLEVSHCNNLLSLGEKEEGDDVGRNILSSLRMLEVYSCNKIEHFCCPNNIEILKLLHCYSLRRVSFLRATTAGGGGGGQKLKTLKIYGCSGLTEKINNTSMPMLEVIEVSRWGNLKSIIQLSNSTHLTEIRIEDCESMESFLDSKLPNLTSLVIMDCKSIKSFPDLRLSNLTWLQIKGNESIESFPNLHLPNLTNLSINRCKNMKSFGDLHMPNLTSWSIYNCKNLESFPDFQLLNLTMLKDLVIRDCPGIDVSFPSGRWPPNLCSLVLGELKKPMSKWGPQHFPVSFVDLWLVGGDASQLSHILPPSLTKLWIEDFDKLESLPENLTSLQHLYIVKCPKMTRLPKTMLPSLLLLSVTECPSLKETYNGRGNDSHYSPLISHIPVVEISD